jgi:hypothetical protein
MQPDFKAANSKRTIRACKELLEQALIDKAAIFLIEYKNFGKTLAPLYKLVENYRHQYKVLKNTDDGAYNVMSAMDKFQVQSNLIKFAGVNTSACVYSTIQTMVASMEAEFELCLDACNDTNSKEYIEPILSYLEEIGVEIL